MMESILIKISFSFFVLLVCFIIVSFRYIKDKKERKKIELCLKRYLEGFIPDGVYEVSGYGIHNYTDPEHSPPKARSVRYIYLLPETSAGVMYHKVCVVDSSKYDVIGLRGNKINSNEDNFTVGSMVRVVGRRITL